MFDWFGLFLFLATAIVFFVLGAVCMAVCATNSRYEDKTDAYNIGYAKGVEAENERIGKLIDKYIENGGSDERTEKRVV